MCNLTETLISEITKSCISSYHNLPKSGKPLKEEWTVLSCVIQYNTVTKEHQVVSLGTGSKCIGALKMSPEGTVLNDSHAEIFARRGFLIYLYNNIMNSIDNIVSIFDKKDEKFELKKDIVFIFYSSQMPCGDASIIPKTEEDFGNLIVKENNIVYASCDLDIKRRKLDVHRTGAKCLSQIDPKGKEENYHIVGQVRTKPGRGDRTLSVSCSDKIARWIHVGIQGSLLDIFLCKPIFIKYFIFGAQMPYSEDTLKRALLMRDCSISVEKRLTEIPKFYQSSVKFMYSKGPDKVRPAGGSIVWVKTNKGLVEVAVHGKKLGVTKKKANSLSNSLSISKYNLFKTFQEVLLKNEFLYKRICDGESLSSIPYNKMKERSVRYQTHWCKTKEVFFKIWTSKPDIWNFTIEKN